MDNRLFTIGTARPGRIRQQNIPELATALVGYWKGFGVLDTGVQMNISYVRLYGQSFDVLVTGEDWLKILPALGNGTLSPAFYPSPTLGFPPGSPTQDFGDPLLYQQTLSVLFSLFPDAEAYPTAPNTVPGFTPTLVPGIVAQLDASRLNSVSLSGNQVTVWKDTVQGQNAYQATPGSRPLYNATALNGLPGVMFDGTQWLDFPLKALQNWSVLIVAKYQLSATSPIGGIVVAAGFEGLGSGLDCYIKQNDDMSPLPGPKGRLTTWIQGDLAAISPYNDALDPNTFRLLYWVQESALGGASRARIGQHLQDVDLASLIAVPPYDFTAEGWDPTRQLAGNPAPLLGAIGRYSGTLASGPTFNFVGTACEILIYNRVLTSAEYTQLSSYLNIKWGGFLL